MDLCVYTVPLSAILARIALMGHNRLGYSLIDCYPLSEWVSLGCLYSYRMRKGYCSCYVCMCVYWA